MHHRNRGTKIAIWSLVGIAVFLIIVALAHRPSIVPVTSPGSSGANQSSNSDYATPQEETLRLAQNLGLSRAAAGRLQASLNRLVAQEKTPESSIIASAQAFVLADDREGLMSDSRKETLAEFINVTQTSPQLASSLIEMGHGLSISRDDEWVRFFDSVNDVRQATGGNGDDSARLVLQLRNLFDTIMSWGFRVNDTAPNIVRNFGVAVGALKSQGIGPEILMKLVNAKGEAYNDWLQQVVILTGMDPKDIKKDLTQGSFIDLLTAIHENLKNVTSQN